MNVIVETVVVLFQVAYFWLQAIVLAFIPASYRSKDVAGETVLVTGAGDFSFAETPGLNYVVHCSLLCNLLYMSYAYMSKLCPGSDAFSVWRFHVHASSQNSFLGKCLHMFQINENLLLSVVFHVVMNMCSLTAPI